MSEAQELAANLRALSGETGKKKKKLYEYDSAMMAKAALLEIKKKELLLGKESATALIAKAEASAQRALQVVDSKEKIVDVQLTLLRASLPAADQAAFDAEYARYDKAKQRSQRGLMGALARQKKLPSLDIQEGRVAVSATARQQDERLQYLEGLTIKNPKKGSYTTLPKTPSAPHAAPRAPSSVPRAAAPERVPAGARQPVRMSPERAAAITNQNAGLLARLLEVPPQRTPQEQNNLLANLLDLNRAPDGTLQPRQPLPPTALPEPRAPSVPRPAPALERQPSVEPAPAPPEINPVQVMQAIRADVVPPALAPELVAAKGDILMALRKRREEREQAQAAANQLEAMHAQQERDVQAMIAAYDKEQEAKRRAAERERRKQEREAKRQKRRDALQQTVHRITPHVTKRGLLLAGAKLATPLALASLPMIVPGAEQFTGHHEAIVASATGLGAGLLAGIPLMDISRKRKRGFSWKRTFTETGRNLANAALVGLTVVTLAQENGAFKALQDIEASLNRPAVAAEIHDYSPYDAAQLAFTNPSALTLDVLQGRRPLTDLTYAQTIPVVRQEFDTERDGKNSETTIQTPALPIIFVTPDGQEVARFNRAIMHPVTEADLPPGFIKYLNAIEELPQHGSPVEDKQTLAFIQAIEADIGPLEITPADVFWARLVKRNTGDGPGGGASTVDTQFFKNIVGYQGADSFINPDIHLKVYHPEKYNPTYLLTLMRAIRRGEVLDPATITMTNDQDAGTIVSDTDKTILSQACEQMERYMYGKLLALQPEFVIGYLNNIHMGAIRGREIIGIDGASQVFFGRHVKELSQAEQIVLLSSIPKISKAIRALDLEIQLEERTKNNEDATDVKKALAELTYTWENLRDAALDNVNEVDKDGLFKTPEEKQQVLAIINKIFVEKDFFMNVPEEFDTDWVAQMTGDLRDQMEPMLMKSMVELANTPGVVLSREGVVVPVTLPDAKNPFFVQNPDVLFHTEAPQNEQLAKMIEHGLKKRVVAGIPYYEVQLEGHTRWVPSFEVSEGQFVPGVGAVVLDGEGRLVAKFDKTGHSLVDVPVRPGSTFKPIIYAFLQSINQITPDSLVDDTSGYLSLGNHDIPIENAPGLGEQGMIPWHRALSESRNIPFMRAMHEYFNNGTEHMTPQERYAEVGKRMVVFQDFLKSKFDLKLVTVDGTEITNPLDESSDADLFPIGYTYLTAAENNMVDVPLADGTTEKVLEMKKSSLAAMAGAFLRLEEPEKFFDDQNMISIAHNTTNTLSVLGLNRFKGKHQFDDAWAKTGTLTLDVGTTATFTGEVIHKGNEVRVVFVQLRGQVINSDGIAKEMNQDVISEMIRKTDAESFKEARPYAEWLVKQSLKLHDTTVVDPNEVIDSLTEIAQGKDPELNIHVLRISADTSLLSNDGKPMLPLQAGQFVDGVGEARDGLQPVAISERHGQVRTLRTGFIRVENLEAPDMVTDPDLQQLMSSDEAVQFLETDQDFAKGTIHFIVLDQDTTSPVLATIFQQLDANNQLATTSDELNKAFPEGRIFINKRRLADFQKENTPGTRALLERELKQVGVEIQLAQAIHAVDPDIDLDSVLMDKNGAPARLLDILLRGEVPGTDPSQELQLLQFPFVESHPMFHDLKTMRTVQNHFDEIMRAIHSNHTPKIENVRGLMAGLKLLQQPSLAEERFLRMPTP